MEYLEIKHLLQCGKLLIRKKLTIAFAESATAGRISAEFALLPDAGKFLIGGVVCYDADLKCNLLGISRSLLEMFTPESEQVTRQITEGIKAIIPADIHIGCTGLTAPGGSETLEKPVGTMFLHAVQGNQLLFSERIVFKGQPLEIILQTITFLAKRLNQHLQK